MSGRRELQLRTGLTLCKPLQLFCTLSFCVVKASVQIIAVNVLSASFWMGGMSGHVQGNMAKYLKAT